MKNIDELKQEYKLIADERRFTQKLVDADPQGAMSEYIAHLHWLDNLLDNLDREIIELTSFEAVEASIPPALLTRV